MFIYAQLSRPRHCKVHYCYYQKNTLFDSHMIDYYLFITAINIALFNTIEHSIAQTCICKQQV